MKVVFVVPIAFERFFHDSKPLFPFPEKFEDEVICKRNTWHFNWCNAMRNVGMDVTFIHISMYGKTVREYHHINGIKIIRVPVSFRSFRHKNEFSISLLKEISRIKPDIVFSVTHILNDIVDMFDFMAIYLKYKGVPLVARNPGADTLTFIFYQRNNLVSKFRHLKNGQNKKHVILKFSILIKIIYTFVISQFKFTVKKISLKNTSLIIPQTGIDYENLSIRFRIKRDHLFMMPKPVDTNNFYEFSKQIAAEKLNMKYENLYLLHVSNLFNTKGCEHIIEILPDLLSSFPDLKLIITGGGDKRKELEALAVKMTIEDHIYFVGQVEHKDLVYYYNLADVFVLPTEIIGEGIPNAILEAIACNTPPISSSLPGPASILKEGLGLVVKTGNEEELFSAITKVLDGSFHIDKDQRTEFLRNYSLENVGLVLKDLFDKITK